MAQIFADNYKLIQEFQMDSKEYHFLLDLLDTPETQDIFEFLKFSEITFHSTTPLFDVHSRYRFNVSVSPNIFKKYQNKLNEFKMLLTEKLRIARNINVTGINVEPNLNQFQIINNSYTLQVTPWAEINNMQEGLFNQLKHAQNPIDFQNIGNTSRTILEKLSNFVYKEGVHIPKDTKLDVSAGKFKNRLLTYFEHELSGSSNKEMRSFALSLINSCLDAIDLSNKLTHDLKASQFIAESSVVGVVSSINIIKLAEQNSKKSSPA